MTNSPIENENSAEQTAQNTVEQEQTEQRRPLAFLYNRKWKKVILIVLAVLLTLCIAAVSIVTVLYHQGKKSLLSNSNVSMTVPDSSGIDVDIEDDGTVIYNGEKYVFNNSVTSILVMGIDKKKFNINKESVKSFPKKHPIIFHFFRIATGYVKCLRIVYRKIN